MEFDFEGSYERPSWLSSFIDEGTEYSHRYYKARTTLLEMLRDRGYIVPNGEIELTLQEFCDRYGDETDLGQLKQSFLHQDDPNNKILVHFFWPGVIKVKDISSFAPCKLDKPDYSRMILIMDDKMTSYATKSLEPLPFQVEIFQVTELLVNITKHEMKPKHQLLTTEEKQRLLEKCNIQEEQLPRILKKDPLVRYFAYEKGMVSKISYNSGHKNCRIVW